MNVPRVSIIIPTYNRARLLKKSVDSVLRQTYPDFEVIIVDDCSSDNTQEIVRQIKDKRVFYYRLDSRKGASFARNFGIKKSQGALIAFQDTDDEWLAEKLQVQVKYLTQSSEDVGVVYGPVWKEECGRRTLFSPPEKNQKISDVHSTLLEGNFVTIQILARRNCLIEAGLFDENLPRFQDWDLWIRISRKYKFLYVDRPLAVVRIYEDSISRNLSSFAQALEIIVKKYSPELNKRKKILAKYYYALGRAWLVLRDPKKGKKFLSQAFLAYPLNLKYAAVGSLSLVGAGFLFSDMPDSEKEDLTHSFNLEAPGPGKKLRRISVILVNYKSADLLGECLRSISHANMSDYEIIVVDNSAEENSLEKLRNEFPEMKILKNSENAGFARAVNQAVEIVQGKYILLLNPDTLVDDDGLLRIAEFLDQNVDIGACGPKLINADGSLQMSSHPMPRFSDMVYDRLHLSRIFARSRIFGRYQMSWWLHDQAREVDWVSGACLMTRKEAWEMVGPLDERFFMFCEDIDWCLRIKKAGWKVVYYPHVKVRHYKGRSSGKVAKAPVESWISLIKFWDKYYGQLPSRALACYFYLDALIKLVILSVLWILSLNNSRIRRELVYCWQICSAIASMNKQKKVA